MKISAERLALTHELEALVVEYWHDVDTNWGRTAPSFYTEDGEFVGPVETYKGRDKIRRFYKWREDRGARTVIHSVSNFRAVAEGEERATANWVMMLYAADGLPPLPSKPPIQVCYMTDRMVRSPEGGWLIESRRFDAWFEGGIPATNPKLDDA